MGGELKNEPFKRPKQKVMVRQVRETKTGWEVRAPRAVPLIVQEFDEERGSG